MGQTIKINKNKPSEHIKSNVKWFNMGLLPVELPWVFLFRVPI